MSFTPRSATVQLAPSSMPPVPGAICSHEGSWPVGWKSCVT